jgi:hypothetical protein
MSCSVATSEPTSVDQHIPAYVLLTDAPPLKEGGHGCHVLAWNWLQMAANDVKLLISHRLNPTLALSQISEDVKAGIAFYPDLAGVRFPQKLQPLKALLELLLFVVTLPKLAAHIRTSRAERVFALFGGNPWFLLVAHWTARWTKLPLDVYLVDDLEESARLAGQPLVARLVRWIEPKVLRSADRIFTISRGYAEHLRAKYEIEAQWLPVAILETLISHHPYAAQKPDVRMLAFIGAVNPLYAGALKDVLDLIREWNLETKSFRLRLLLLTYTEVEYIEKELGGSPDMAILLRPSKDEFLQQLRTCWAIILPYSFEENVRLMVSTSFPTKVVDSLPVGRPIVVYGPSYASVPRYFKENRIPLCAHSRSELKAVLQQVEQNDTVKLVQSYQMVIERLHSAGHLRSVLAADSDGISGMCR